MPPNRHLSMCRELISARCLVGGMVPLLMGGQQTSQVMWSPQPCPDVAVVPPGCWAYFAGRWARRIRKLEDEVNGRAQEKTERLMAGTQSKTKVKMEMLII